MTIDAQENIEAIIAQAEVVEIIAAETNEMPVTDPRQALAEANGFDADAAAAQAQADLDQAPAQDQAAPYADLIAAVTETQAREMQDALVAQLSARAQYEAEKSPNNLNIQKTLSKLAKKQVTPGIVRGMIVTGTDAGVINRSEMGEKRRNVYALEKLHDLLYAAVTGHMGNAINRAIVASMVKLGDVQLPFTAVVAKAAASDKCPVENHYKPHMRRHTVSESTAPTQMSSTMTALEDLGVVVNKGGRNTQVWEFTDTPLARRLIEVARTKILVPVI